MPSLISKSSVWQALSIHASEVTSKFQLKDLLNDPNHCELCQVEYDNILLDFSRQRVNKQTIGLLFKLAQEANLHEKIKSLAEGKHLNTTEGRAVGHIALRSVGNRFCTGERRKYIVELVAERNYQQRKGMLYLWNRSSDSSLHEPVRILASFFISQSRQILHLQH